MPRVNLTNEAFHFANGDSRKLDALSSMGCKLQMVRGGIVQAATPEDIETLYEFAEQLREVARLQGWGIVPIEPKPDVEYGEYTVSGQLQK